MFGKVKFNVLKEKKILYLIFLNRTTRKSMFHARSGHAACILKDSPNLKMYSNNTKTLPESPCYEAIEKQNDDF